MYRFLATPKARQTTQAGVAGPLHLDSIVFFKNANHTQVPCPIYIQLNFRLAPQILPLKLFYIVIMGDAQQANGARWPVFCRLAKINCPVGYIAFGKQLPALWANRRKRLCLGNLKKLQGYMHPHLPMDKPNAYVNYAA